MIVYISIGNSDDKLTQRQWSSYWHEVNNTIAFRRIPIHGWWLSPGNLEYQNACWCIEMNLGPAGRADFKEQLAELARKYGQDSISWAPVKETEFLY